MGKSFTLSGSNVAVEFKTGLGMKIQASGDFFTFSPPALALCVGRYLGQLHAEVSLTGCISRLAGIHQPFLISNTSYSGQRVGRAGFPVECAVRGRRSNVLTLLFLLWGMRNILSRIVHSSRKMIAESLGWESFPEVTWPHLATLAQNSSTRLFINILRLA